MQFTLKAIRVSGLALALAALPALATNFAGAKLNTEPVYNSATMVDVEGTITAVRNVPAGNPMPGTHLTVKTKTDSLDIYLGPSSFIKFLKTSFPVGREVSVLGSKVNFRKSAVVLTNQIDIGPVALTLRDETGAPVWQNWGVQLG